LNLVAVSHVGYILYNGFGPTVGLSVNAQTGLSPMAGLQYAVANEKNLSVVTPTLEFAKIKNLQGHVIGEYRPA
jgi:hypothetical protein